MTVNIEYITEILTRLSPLGTVTFRRMFGGTGIFIEGNMFAKISPSNILSFKADEHNKSIFIKTGMNKSGKMPYYEVTAEQIEDSGKLLAAARLACEAAWRAKKIKLK